MRRVELACASNAGVGRLNSSTPATYGIAMRRVEAVYDMWNWDTTCAIGMRRVGLACALNAGVWQLNSRHLCEMWNWKATCVIETRRVELGCDVWHRRARYMQAFGG